jgi:hypothetical protein
MFLINTNFKKDLIVLFIITIIIGSLLISAGAYITQNYFSYMVEGLIGDYGEYDILFTLSIDKEDIAVKQIENVINMSFPGSILKSGPKVAGSSNYLLKFPEEYKNKEVYSNLNRYFSDIPGLLSKTIMTEPRLSIRGFRGDTLEVLRPFFEKIEGVNFIYPIFNGIDIIAEKAEFLPDVKNELENILNKYQLMEIRYPLDQHPENLDKLRKELVSSIKTDLNIEEVRDITKNNDSDRMTLLNSLEQMKTFLLSYASKVVIKDIKRSEDIPLGGELIIPGEEGEYAVLEVIDNSNNTLVSLIQEGEIIKTSPEVYLRQSDGSQGEFIGIGDINNPRQELINTLEKLNELTPVLNGFISQSEQLVDYSARIEDDLDNLTNGLNKLEKSSQELSKGLKEWQEEGLSIFLQDLLKILDEIEANTVDLNYIQVELVKTSNKLKSVAGMIAEKLIYVPRNNSLYSQLNELKNLFLQLSTALDENYDLIAERLSDIHPVISSINDWKQKINSLLKLEGALNSGANWKGIENIILKVDETTQVLDTRELQAKLESIRELLMEIKTEQLPVIIEQLSYIQESLPELEESEIVENISLIDSYIAGQVIPGDQVQLLIKGNLKEKEILEVVKPLVNNLAVSYILMNAGLMQINPRGEVFNLLSQVKAVISTIIAIVYTLLIMIMDQTLIVSVIKLNKGRGYIYSFLSGGIILSSIYFLSRIDFPYLNFYINFVIGGFLGMLIGLFSLMLNPVNEEEWEAGKALGFSFAEIMHEIVIPAGKPGLLYLLNYPGMIFK